MHYLAPMSLVLENKRLFAFFLLSSFSFLLSRIWLLLVKTPVFLARVGVISHETLKNEIINQKLNFVFKKLFKSDKITFQKRFY